VEVGKGAGLVRAVSSEWCGENTIIADVAGNMVGVEVVMHGAKILQAV